MFCSYKYKKLLKRNISLIETEEMEKETDVKLGHEALPLKFPPGPTPQ